MNENQYLWLVKHLIWNGSKQINGTYWVKLSEADADMLKSKYEVVDTRVFKKKTLSVIRMLGNNIVLETP